MAKLLLKYPTRGQPTLFFQNLKSWITMLSGEMVVEVRATMDKDDPTMNTPEVYEYLKNIQDGLNFRTSSRINFYYYFGDSKTKIEACNADMHGADFDMLILVSDDMKPMMSSYDTIIANELFKNYPNTDGAMHFNDGKVGRRCCTLSIMGYELYKSFGYIYHPDYKSLWCDVEFTEVCQRDNKIVYDDRMVVRHFWDPKGKIDPDTKQEPMYLVDKETYLKRKEKGFPHETVLEDVQSEVK